MATQITKWITFDKKEFDGELEALRHENEVLLSLRQEREIVKETEENKVKFRMTALGKKLVHDCIYKSRKDTCAGVTFLD